MKKAFKGFSGAVVVDINLKANVPFTAYSTRLTEAKFAKLFAMFIGRQAFEQTTGWTFRRSSNTTISAYDSWKDVSKWLSKLPEDELSQLCRLSEAFQNLSAETQQLLAKNCGNPGLQTKMANGDFATASVRFCLMLQLKDKDGKVQSWSADPFGRDSEQMDAMREKLEKNYKAPEVVVEAKRTLSGDLDMAAGELLTLEQVAARAKKALKKAYIYDGRLKDSLYYWQGKFDEKTFLEYLKAIAVNIEPAEWTSQLSDIKATIEQGLKDRIAHLVDSAGLPAGLSMQDAFSGKQMTLGQLAALMPSVANIMRDGGFSPDTQITLGAGLELQLVAPGGTVTDPKESPLGNRWSMVFGPVK